MIDGCINEHNKIQRAEVKLNWVELRGIAQHIFIIKLYIVHRWLDGCGAWSNIC